MVRKNLNLCAASLISLMAIPLLHGKACATDEPVAEVRSSDQIADLREQLMNGLRVVRPEDRLFVERVVQLVQQRRLKRSLVNYTYKLSIERRPDNPVSYFRRVLTVLAARQGVQILLRPA